VTLAIDPQRLLVYPLAPGEQAPAPLAEVDAETEAVPS
jgi:putative spermidine/putrescine transport system ATP-binding protein